MAGNNRIQKGPKDEVRGQVKGNIVIEAGDLLILNDSDGIVGPGSTVVPIDNYVYPFSQMSATTGSALIEQYIHQQFIGVAMNGSKSGITETIDVATDGIFRYPIYGAPSAVTLDARISAVSAHSISSGSSNQFVVNSSDRVTIAEATTAYIGICVKTESGASFVDFTLRTNYNRKLR